VYYLEVDEDTSRVRSETSGPGRASGEPLAAATSPPTRRRSRSIATTLGDTRAEVRIQIIRDGVCVVAARHHANRSN
jgi:hypothetical protein